MRAYGSLPRVREPAAQFDAPTVVDWFFVLSGRVAAALGVRETMVATGQVDEVAATTPHAITAIDRLCELIVTFERDGQHAHTRHRAEQRRVDSTGESTTTRSAGDGAQ